MQDVISGMPRLQIQTDTISNNYSPNVARIHDLVNARLQDVFDGMPQLQTQNVDVITYKSAISACDESSVSLLVKSGRSGDSAATYLGCAGQSWRCGDVLNKTMMMSRSLVQIATM